jgi:hypothetical protein
MAERKKCYRNHTIMYYKKRAVVRLVLQGCLVCMSSTGAALHPPQQTRGVIKLFMAF